MGAGSKVRQPSVPVSSPTRRGRPPTSRSATATSAKSASWTAPSNGSRKDGGRISRVADQRPNGARTSAPWRSKAGTKRTLLACSSSQLVVEAVRRGRDQPHADDGTGAGDVAEIRAGSRTACRPCGRATADACRRCRPDGWRRAASRASRGPYSPHASAWCRGRPPRGYLEERLRRRPRSSRTVGGTRSRVRAGCRAARASSRIARPGARCLGARPRRCRAPQRQDARCGHAAPRSNSWRPADSLRHGFGSRDECRAGPATVDATISKAGAHGSSSCALPFGSSGTLQPMVAVKLTASTILTMGGSKPRARRAGARALLVGLGYVPARDRLHARGRPGRRSTGWSTSSCSRASCSASWRVADLAGRAGRPHGAVPGPRPGGHGRGGGRPAPPVSARRPGLHQRVQCVVRTNTYVALALTPAVLPAAEVAVAVAVMVPTANLISVTALARHGTRPATGPGPSRAGGRAEPADPRHPRSVPP